MMPAALASKTVQVAFAFAGIGVGLVLFDTVMGYCLGYKVRYVPETMALLSAMFTGIAAKNGVDNFISYRRETTTQAAYGPPPR